MIQLNNDNFKIEVINSKTPVIIDFFADWCGPCGMMAPVFEELSREYEGKLKFTKANVDENNELATQYEVSGIPCLIIMKKGKEIGRIVGFASKDELKSKINELLKK